MKGWTSFVGITSAVVVASAVVGCGSDNNQAQVKAAHQAGVQQEKLKDLQRQVNQQKKAPGATNATTGSGGTSSSSGGGSGGVSGANACGDGLYAGPNTTCPFAQAVRAAYFRSGGGTTTVSAFSPTTGRSYSMSCSGSSPTACTGGNNASVYFY